MKDKFAVLVLVFSLSLVGLAKCQTLQSQQNEWHKSILNISAGRTASGVVFLVDSTNNFIYILSVGHLGPFNCDDRGIPFQLTISYVSNNVTYHETKGAVIVGCSQVQRLHDGNDEIILIRAEMGASLNNLAITPALFSGFIANELNYFESLRYYSVNYQENSVNYNLNSNSARIRKINGYFSDSIAVVYPNKIIVGYFPNTSVSPITGAISRGESGGGLFTKDGIAIGLLMGEVEDNSLYFGFVPVNALVSIASNFYTDILPDDYQHPLNRAINDLAAEAECGKKLEVDSDSLYTAQHYQSFLGRAIPVDMDSTYSVANIREFYNQTLDAIPAPAFSESNLGNPLSSDAYASCLMSYYLERRFGINNVKKLDLHDSSVSILPNQ